MYLADMPSCKQICPHVSRYAPMYLADMPSCKQMCPHVSRYALMMPDLSEFGHVTGCLVACGSLWMFEDACGCLGSAGWLCLPVDVCGCLGFTGCLCLHVDVCGCLGLTGCMWLSDWLPVVAYQASRRCLPSRSPAPNRLLPRSVDGCRGKQKEDSSF